MTYLLLPSVKYRSFRFSLAISLDKITKVELSVSFLITQLMLTR